MTQPRQSVEVVFLDDGYGRTVVRGIVTKEHECAHCGAGTPWLYARNDLQPKPFCTILCYERWARRQGT